VVKLTISCTHVPNTLPTQWQREPPRRLSTKSGKIPNAEPPRRAVMDRGALMSGIVIAPESNASESARDHEPQSTCTRQQVDIACTRSNSQPTAHQVAARVATGHDGRTTDSRRPQRHRAQSIPDVNYYGDGGDAYGAEGSDGGAYDTSTSAGYSDFGFDEEDAAAAAGNGKPGQ